MKPRFTITEADALLALPRPDTKAMTDRTEEEKQAIDNRVGALVALLGERRSRKSLRRIPYTPRHCVECWTFVPSPPSTAGSMASRYAFQGHDL